MENTYSKNKVTFPIMPDDAVFVPDHRVILTNDQLLTRNPSPALERFDSSTAVAPSDLMTDAGQQSSFEQRRQMPTTAGKRPLSQNYNPTTSNPTPKKSSLVEESRKRARENAVAPKPVKPYVNPLERTSSDELGIKGLANKKVVQSQHSLGEPISGFNKTVSKTTSGSLFDQEKDYFESKHQQRGRFDQVD